MSLAPSPCMPGEYLRVRRNGDIPKTREFFYLPWVGNLKQFHVFNSSIDNLEKAIKERVFYRKGESGFVTPFNPPLSHVHAGLKVFRTALCKRLSHSIPVSPVHFVSLYKDRRKNIYEKARISLESTPLERRDAYIKSFVKAEKVDGEVPRVIQPRDPRYNLELGRYLKPLEKPMYRAIASIYKRYAKTKTPIVVKGFNASQTGEILYSKWKRFRSPVAIPLDASRFDQSVLSSILQWEHSIYMGIFGKYDKHLRKLLSWQIDNIGVGYTKDGRLRYRKKGGRMSGDMNTAMGNCLIMTALIFSFMQPLGIKYDVADNGDDALIFVESEHLLTVTGQIKEWFSSYGFVLKLDQEIRVFEQIQFCQTNPVMTPEGYIMTRDPRTAISKDCHCIFRITPKSAYEKYLYVLGSGGLSLSGGIPMWQHVYNTMVNIGKHAASNKVIIESGMMQMARDMHRKYETIAPITRYSFWLAFNIDPDTQEAFEKTLIQWRYEEPVHMESFPSAETY